MAEKLRKGLILLTCSGDGKAWIEGFGVPYVALPAGKDAWKTAIDGLPTAFNAVLAIALSDREAPRRSFSHPRQLLRNFRDCKVAYLVIPSRDSSLKIQVSVTALTLNHQRESKEKLVWASYFARFIGSRTVIMHYDYRDAAFRLRLRNNRQYLDKLFSGLGLTYDTEILTGNELRNPDLQAIKKGHFDLIIILVADRRERDLGDLFTMAPELRILRSVDRKPVLFINQRDDLYIMCD